MLESKSCQNSHSQMVTNDTHIVQVSVVGSCNLGHLSVMSHYSRDHKGQGTAGKCRKLTFYRRFINTTPSLQVYIISELSPPNKPLHVKPPTLLRQEKSKGDFLRFFLRASGCTRVNMPFEQIQKNSDKPFGRVIFGRKEVGGGYYDQLNFALL